MSQSGIRSGPHHGLIMAGMIQSYAQDKDDNVPVLVLLRGG